jgi:hypothetical protein
LGVQEPSHFEELGVQEPSHFEELGVQEPRHFEELGVQEPSHFLLGQDGVTDTRRRERDTIRGAAEVPY